jgi:hypothetical protein
MKKKSMVDQVKDLLTEYGPMTAREIAAELGRGHRVITATICGIRQREPGVLRICKYERVIEGERDYPRPLYALEPGEDAPKPRPLLSKVRSARWRESVRGQASSVWDWATPVKYRKLKTERRTFA